MIRRKPLRRVGKRGAIYKRLDKLLHELVVLRDGGVCRFGDRCPFRDKHSFTGRGFGLQAMHIYGKGAYPALRYEPLNVISGCGPVHAWWHQIGFGRESEERRNVVRELCVSVLGADYLARLDLFAHTRSRVDLEAVDLYLQLQIKALGNNILDSPRAND